MSTVENLQRKFNKSLLSKKEVAIELSISQATLDRIRKAGLIRSKKVSGGVFFTLNEVAAYIDEV